MTDDQGINSVQLPTDHGDGQGNSTTNNDFNSLENALSITNDSTGNQSQTLHAIDNTALPQLPTPDHDPNYDDDDGNDEQTQGHETTEADGYHPQTLDVGSDRSCFL